jgi:predicted SprT family Zn-dependent metalloprotease
LAPPNPWRRSADTPLHEIAHAWVGPKHGHDRVWKATAEAVGCRPQRCYSAQAVRVLFARYRFECPACGHTGTRLRIRVSSCGRCDPKQLNPQYLLRWTDLQRLPQIDVKQGVAI